MAQAQTLMGPAICDAGSRWRAFGLALLGSANALWLVWGGAAGSGAARQLAAVLGGACIGAAALLWIALERRFEQTPLGWVVGLALLLRLIATQASPLLEDDHYRYLWDGLRTATAFDPYRLPPSAYFGAQDLSPQWQDILSGINYPDIPTIYGPVLQALFALAHAIEPGRVGAVQALLLVADMAVLGLLARQGVGTRWLLAYAVHPLILKEAMASAHPDGLVALWLLLALAAWQRRRPGWVGVMLALAVGTKVAALVALPLLLLCRPQPQSTVAQATEAPAGTVARWAWRLTAGFVAALALLYLPFMLAGGSDAAALASFGSQWRFNPLLYRIVEAAVPAAAARPLAALLTVAGLLAIIWHWRRNTRPAADRALPPLDAALTLLLLLSPVVNPWYWLWALGLSVGLGRWRVAAGFVIAVLSYLNSTVLLEAVLWSGPEPAAPYLVPWPLALVQTMVLLGAFLASRGCGRSPLPRVIL